ncbi:MAG: hypothetical protein VCC99_15825, partial [Alphaproteobacteria bacterium]
LTKAVVESDVVVDEGEHYALSGAVDGLTIPDTLHDSLKARLDKLMPVNREWLKSAPRSVGSSAIGF